MRSAGSFFFPLDERLELGTEGYSPLVLSQAVRQASKAASFAEASDDLRELARIEISPTHLQRVSERIGVEWAQSRDGDVEKFRQLQLERTHPEAPPGAAAVMLDGGRVQTRADDGEGRGVREAGWRESKVACCLTLQTKAAASDPHPEPPAKFLEPTTVVRVAAEIKRRGSAAAEASEERTEKKNSSSRRRKRRRKQQRSLPKRLRKKKVSRTRVRTVVATMENSDTFGWQVAAEVHRRGLDQMKRKACVCDGQAYNWSVYEMHLRPLNFVPILDFVHLVAYLYDAAQACGGSPSQAWQRYERWLRWAWAGKVSELLSQLRAAAATSHRSPSHRSPREGKTILDETITYVTNNRQRMDYPEYRRLGLPISSAPVESTIKQINRRVKGSEKFWLTTGAEAMLQLRSAQLSQDDRWRRNWQRRRPHHRAAASHRLSQAC